jgi:protein O-mannosyl-transferase
MPILLLVIATLLVYSVSFNNGFVLDDVDIIVRNPQTLSLQSIPDVLFSPDMIKPYYRPLNRASYLLDYQLAGLNPAWYHGINIIIHLGNVILLYLVCRRFLPEQNAALMVALLFAVHPVNTESVNLISARNTLLALFFSLAALLAFVDARVKKRKLLLSALFFFCGLLSKETGFMLIAVVALYCMIPLPGQDEDQRPWQERLSALLPFMFATLVYVAMRTYSLKGIIGVDVPAADIFSRLAQNYHIIPQYLELLLFPTNLTFSHSVPKGGVFSPPWFFVAWLALLATISLIIRSRNRVALFGLAWFIINYVPISNVVPIPSTIIAERYIYLPAAGFFIGLGVLLSCLNSRQRNRQLLWGGVTIIIMVCAAVTVQRNLDWKSDFSLFSSDSKSDPKSPEAHFNLGMAYREIGDLVLAKKEWEGTLAMDPAHVKALIQMGTLVAMQGDLQKAESYYLKSLKVPSGTADSDKSMAYYNLGKIYEKLNLPQKALQHYEQFLKVVPPTYLEYKPDAEQRLARLRRALSDFK